MGFRGGDQLVPQGSSSCAYKMRHDANYAELASSSPLDFPSVIMRSPPRNALLPKPKSTIGMVLLGSGSLSLLLKSLRG